MKGKDQRDRGVLSASVHFMLLTAFDILLNVLILK